MKRFIPAFIFISLGDGSINGVLLKDVFVEAQSLFRPREEMMGLFHWIVVGPSRFGALFRHDLRQRIRRGGIAAGVRLGIMLEILAIGARCAIYATQRFPQSSL